MTVIGITGAGDLLVDGVPTGANLTKTEAALLRAIMTRGSTATKEALLGDLYGGRDEPDLKIIDFYVCKLRKKLGVQAPAIQTVWGQGYIKGYGYSLELPDTDAAVRVDAKLLDDVAYASGDTPTHLVTRLLKAEYARLWA